MGMDDPVINRQQLLNWLRAARGEITVAGLFLTRLPFPATAGAPLPPLARTVWSFPLIGLLVGLISGAALMLASKLSLHPLACAMIALAVAALVTGALHEDGLADVVDGFGGGRLREDKLRIMRDSQIGTYGVLALIFSVGLRASLVAGLLGPGLAAAALAGAAVLSRSLMPGIMVLMPQARVDGLAASAGRPTPRQAQLALGIGFVLAWPLLGFWAGCVAMIAALAATLLMATIARRQIGGYTGDVLGASQQAAEISILLTAGAFAL